MSFGFNRLVAIGIVTLAVGPPSTAAAAVAPTVPAPTRVIPVQTAPRATLRPGVTAPVPVERNGPAMGAPLHNLQRGPHVIYGTIVTMSGTRLTVRTRSGRLATVDASPAISSGNYSNPLFVGKVVSIDGDWSNGVVIASHIMRLFDLRSLPNDR